MFSIIIPVGPGRDARTALASLPDAGLSPEDDVVVVGDGHRVTIPGKLSPFQVQSGATEVPMGANAVRNKGVRMAQNPVLCFLDDDDAYVPCALHRLKEAIQRNPAAEAWSLSWRFASGRRQWTFRRPAILTNNLIRKRNIAGGCSSLVVRKNTFEAVGAFDEAMSAMQDWDLWLRLSVATPISVVQPPVVIYNDHFGPRISTNLPARIAGLERLLAKHGSQWPASVTAFHRARLACERCRLGSGKRTGIFQAAAPFASVFFFAKSFRR
ncbi:MAG: glycosyltransferase [Opitutales bacterium]|nr:glycosyltransferase [Opitutales bacterium]